MTPIKMGAFIFPGIKNADLDMVPLSMASTIFCNGKTGLADKLTLDGKIMGAVLMPLSLEDYGANVMFYIPKLLGQSHEKAGKLILDCF